jgi:3-deoxy-D-arabino-heptulosonate 7-phosphate (DAHP) synthase
MRSTIHKRIRFAAALCTLAAGMTALVGPATAAGPEKYLHVNVQDPTKSESVNVNVPLSMAVKILPAIKNNNLHDGKVSIHNTDMNGVDVRALLDAVRTAPDNEFVTVKEKDSDVRVAKANGNIVIHVIDRTEKQQTVDVTIPMKVVDALVANAKSDELDIAGALQVLSDAGDVLLVTVHDSSEKVRIWVDSKNSQD